MYTSSDEGEPLTMPPSRPLPMGKESFQYEAADVYQRRSGWLLELGLGMSHHASPRKQERSSKGRIVKL